MEANVQRDYQPLFSLVQPLHTEMADRGAFTVYTATRTCSCNVSSPLQGFCKILYMHSPFRVVSRLTLECLEKSTSSSVSEPWSTEPSSRNGFFCVIIMKPQAVTSWLQWSNNKQTSHKPLRSWFRGYNRVLLNVRWWWWSKSWTTCAVCLNARFARPWYG